MRSIGAGAALVVSLTSGSVAENVATRMIDGTADAIGRAYDSAARWVDTTLDAAEQSVVRTHGAFAYTPGVGDSCLADWSGIASVERATSAVVLVHGLDEPGDVWCDLAPALFDANIAVIRFDYPNDQPIAASGRAMFEAMREVRSLGVERVRIVGHSMGGLVAQEMLTAEDLYHGAAEVDGLPRVESLIAVGTPFRGSVLAQFQFVGEVRDHLVRCVGRNGGDPRSLLGFMYDGRGEAGDDLMPNSAYLCAVSDRSISPEIAVTSIVGRALPVDGQRVSRALEGSWVAEAVGDARVDAMVRLAERAANGLGDGAVCAASACGMPGAEEVVVRANHRSLLRRMGALDSIAAALGAEPGEPAAIPEILARVRAQ